MKPITINEIDTPGLLIDLDQVEKNLQQMQVKHIFMPRLRILKLKVITI